LLQQGATFWILDGHFVNRSFVFNNIVGSIFIFYIFRGRRGLRTILPSIGKANRKVKIGAQVTFTTRTPLFWTRRAGLRILTQLADVKKIRRFEAIANRHERGSATLSCQHQRQAEIYVEHDGADRKITMTG
jgi:hypothetical protein